MQLRVVVVEDALDYQKIISFSLSEHFDVTLVDSIDLAIVALQKQRPDLLIVDLGLPSGNGLELVRFVKRSPNFRMIPVIIVSGRVTEDDIVKGFEEKADDYVTKPLSPRLLLSRCLSLVENSRQRKADEGDIIESGFRLRVLSRTLTTPAGLQVDLTPVEFQITAILLKGSGKVVARHEILRALKLESLNEQSRAIDVHIASLRKKCPEIGSRIRSVYREGYAFDVREMRS